MARAKLGMIVTEINGKIGGNVFRQVKGKTVISTKSTNANRTKRQLNVGLMLTSTVTQAWSSLDSDTQDKYIQAAKNFIFAGPYGSQKNLSGRELFIKLNGNRLKLNLPFISDFNFQSSIETQKALSLFCGAEYGPELAPNNQFLEGEGDNFTGWLKSTAFGNTITESINGGINNKRAVKFETFSSTSSTFIYFILPVNNFVKKIVAVGKKLNLGSNNMRISYPTKVLAYSSDDWQTFTVNQINNVNQCAFNPSLFLNSSGILNSVSVKDTMGTNCQLVFANPLSNVYILVQAELIKYFGQAISSNRKEIISYKLMNNDTSFEFGAQLKAKFPNIKQGDKLRIYYSFQNLTGFRSKQMIIETTVDE